MFSCTDCKWHINGLCNYGLSVDDYEDAYDCPRFEDRGDETRKFNAAKSEVNTPAELYEYCQRNGAENWKIVILTEAEVDKERGLWLVSDRKEVLIVI